jgi:transposase InsO family protein
MDLHRNAKSCPSTRKLLVHRLRRGWDIQEAAEVAGISVRSAYKWLKRFQEGGSANLRDKSSRPHHSPRAVPLNRRQVILRLRQQRMTAAQISVRLKMPRSTIARVLSRAGLGRLKFLDRAEPVRRYQRESPGELLHLDIKKLGCFRRVGHRITGDKSWASRGAGWEFVHVCVDDATRLAYVGVFEDEKGCSAARFLEDAIAWFQRLGIRVQSALTDNGSCYRSREFHKICSRFEIRHLFTKPYRPQTNGKAERFIQTLLREWAYSRPYRNSVARRQKLPKWISFYNRHRPHASLKGRSPYGAWKSIQG